METKLPGWGSKYYQIGRDCSSHKMAQKTSQYISGSVTTFSWSWKIAFQQANSAQAAFCLFPDAALERKVGRAVPISGNSGLHSPHPHLYQGTAGFSHLPLSHPNHLSEPGRYRSVSSRTPFATESDRLLAGGGASYFLQAVGVSFWVGLGLQGQMGHRYLMWATNCWRSFHRQCYKLLLKIRTEHKDCHRFNVAHLKKEIFKVSFTNETDSHTLKRKHGIESIKAEKNIWNNVY